ncbi:hypothetical protein [Empedobacter falsenii]|uniref:Bacteriocin n=1 Tax=Empedobacter falsenii TaxID=343874 RepID=A0AAW7DJD2_9FLAO|nr:hypothetical protein [Empedobacter falsenii]MDM1551668.1 hypothetical protein [Empedobacter falsenii]
MKNLKQFEINKNNQKTIKGGGPGGSIRYPVNGQCEPGWWLCPSGICLFDNAGKDPIQEGSQHYKICFNY